MKNAAYLLLAFCLFATACKKDKVEPAKITTPPPIPNPMAGALDTLNGVVK